MASKYSVSLQKIISEHGYETLYLPCDASDIFIESQEVNRPGLLLTDHDAHFDPARVRFIGLSEMEYIKSLPKEKMLERIEALTSQKPPVIIITRNFDVPDGFLQLAEKYKVPVLRTAESTSSCMATLIYFLGTQLAERITRHGVLFGV